MPHKDRKRHSKSRDLEIARERDQKYQHLLPSVEEKPIVEKITKKRRRRDGIELPEGPQLPSFLQQLNAKTAEIESPEPPLKRTSSVERLRKAAAISSLVVNEEISRDWVETDENSERSSHASDEQVWKKFFETIEQKTARKAEIQMQLDAEENKKQEILRAQQAATKAEEKRNALAAQTLFAPKFSTLFSQEEKSRDAYETQERLGRRNIEHQFKRPGATAPKPAGYQGMFKARAEIAATHPRVPTPNPIAEAISSPTAKRNNPLDLFDIVIVERPATTPEPQPKETYFGGLLKSFGLK